MILAISTLALLALAVAPGLAIAIYIYIKDKYEREPFTMLLAGFLLGVLSIGVTLVLSQLLHAVIDLRTPGMIGSLKEAFIGVALVEEFSKFVFVRWVLFPNRHFNEPFDGIVYAVMVSMGFATLENILYVFEGGVQTAILRMFTAVPAHATFGVLMGYFLGLAKFRNRKSLLAVLGLLSATIFHGAYDFFLFISYQPGLVFGAFASLGVSIFLSKRAIRIHQKLSPFKI